MATSLIDAFVSRMKVAIFGEREVVEQVFFGHDAVSEEIIGDLIIRYRSNGLFAPEVGMKVKVWVPRIRSRLPSIEAIGQCAGASA